MTISAADVARAYSNIAKNVGVSDESKSAGEVGGGSFQDFLKEQVSSITRTGIESESATIASVSGKADLVDVVTAISAAEVTLETVVAVRDKVIGAYNEIMRMPI